MNWILHKASFEIKSFINSLDNINKAKCFSSFVLVNQVHSNLYLISWLYCKLNLSHILMVLYLWSVGGQRQMMSPLRTLCFFYHIKQLDSILPWVCTVIDHRLHHQWYTQVTYSAAPHVPLFRSFLIWTSSVIYYWTDVPHHRMYLLNRVFSYWAIRSIWFSTFNLSLIIVWQWWYPVTPTFFLYGFDEYFHNRLYEVRCIPHSLKKSNNHSYCLLFTSVK